ncbi:glycoside hydrolase family 27 protein [Luteolibacter sp. LG18]|uniref:glycoside hydrolase family 27 protein n=1 Tax=Luteolibacter sp. LG18 TaxID=2819286 RepID=UPI0030C6C976
MFRSLLFLSLSAGLVHAEAPPRPLVPIMGWSSWNHFRVKIDETIIRGQADAMAANGMKEVGYRFVNIDDGFFGGRDAKGNLLYDDGKFPSGMKDLATYIHGKGLKAGIYSDVGADTCGSQYDKDQKGFGSGLFGHEEQDLKLMLKDWGFDFIKIDWCGGRKQKLKEQESYTKLSKTIRSIRPDVVYNVCRWQYPGDWVKDVADSWRISSDINARFDSIMAIVDKCEPLWPHSGPGHFNDMDMLQVGRGMKPEEDRAHFTMWCIMDSPLLAGNDLRSMSKETLEILTNKEVIALNQDPLAYQARRLRDDGDLEFWAKPLGKIDGGDVAVVLLNRSDKSADIAFDLSAAGIDPAAGYALRDLWKHETQTGLKDATLRREVPAHGVVALRIKGKPAAANPFAK